jgi:hypothetical protein
MHYAKALRVALQPLKVVHQTPGKVCVDLDEHQHHTQCLSSRRDAYSTGQDSCPELES